VEKKGKKSFQKAFGKMAGDGWGSQPACKDKQADLEEGEGGLVLRRKKRGLRPTSIGGGTWNNLVFGEEKLTLNEKGGVINYQQITRVS